MNYQKYLSSIIILMCSIGLSNATYPYQLNLSNGEKSDKILSNTTSRNITTSSNTNQIKVDYSIPYISILTDSITGLSEINIDDFYIIQDENKPAVVARGDSFEIPDGQTLKLNLSNCDYIDLNLSLKSTDSFNSISGEQISNNPQFEYEGFYPQTPVSIAEKICYKGHDIQYINVVPVAYNAHSSTLRVYTKLSYEIDFTQSLNRISSIKKAKPISQTPVEDDAFLSSILTYYSKDVTVIKETRDGAQMITAPDLLIVTHPDLLPAVNKYAEWKKLTGLNIKIYSEYNWTCDEIMTQLNDYYESKYPLGLLIVGSTDLVPTNRISNEFFSDITYACADGEFDIYPDILYSRIPAQSNAEAEEVFHKLISYDQSGLSNPDAYKRILGAANFVDVPSTSSQNDKKFQDRDPYTENMECVGSYISSKGLEYIRQYYCSPNASPTHFYSGTAIPDFLKKPNYNWDANCTSIREYINDGVNLVIYRGHGNTNGWTHSSTDGTYLFEAPESRLLTNLNNYPLMLCLTCLNGNFTDGTIHKKCFANESFIYDKKGCMGVFASESKILTEVGDILLKEWINTLLPNPGLDAYIDEYTDLAYYTKAITPTRFRVGDIINNVWASTQSVMRKLNMSDQYIYKIRSSYNFFGDASMDYYWSKPTKGVYTKSLYFNNTYIQVDTPINSTLVFYNPEKDLVTYGYGKSMVYQNSNPSTIDKLCFSVRPYRGLPAYYLPGHNPFNDSFNNDKTDIPQINNITQIGESLKIELSDFNKNNYSNTKISISNIMNNSTMLTKRIDEDNIIINNFKQGFYIATLHDDETIYEFKKFVIK